MSSGGFDGGLIDGTGFAGLSSATRKITLFSSRWRYINPLVDKLTEAGRRELDRSKRIGIYDQVQRIIAEDVPVIPLFHEDNVVLMNQDVEGYAITPNARLIGIATATKKPREYKNGRSVGVTAAAHEALRLLPDFDRRVRQGRFEADPEAGRRAGAEGRAASEADQLLVANIDGGAVGEGTTRERHTWAEGNTP